MPGQIVIAVPTRWSVVKCKGHLLRHVRSFPTFCSHIQEMSAKILATFKPFDAPGASFCQAEGMVLSATDSFKGAEQRAIEVESFAQCSLLSNPHQPAPDPGGSWDNIGWAALFITAAHWHLHSKPSKPTLQPQSASKSVCDFHI